MSHPETFTTMHHTQGLTHPVAAGPLLDIRLGDGFAQRQNVLHQLLPMKKLLLAAALLVSAAANATSNAPRCAATTQAGTQCTRHAQEGKTTCKQHDPAANHCGAPTKAGGPCKVLAKPGQRCHLHNAK